MAFLSLNASEFVEMFAGVGAARVRDLFNQARRRTAPAPEHRPPPLRTVDAERRTWLGDEVPRDFSL